MRYIGVSNCCWSSSSLASGGFRNRWQRMGVTVIARSHDKPSVIMITIDIERRYSPDECGAKASGTNISTVVIEEISSGIASFLPVLAAASIRPSPRNRRCPISSDTTMPLSTRSPSEMINVASEIRCIAIPATYMPAMTRIIVNGTWRPTMRPVRTPRKATITTSTIAIVWKRLFCTDDTARSTWVGW